MTENETFEKNSAALLLLDKLYIQISIKTQFILRKIN
jgi:hypothetical protein